MVDLPPSEVASELDAHEDAFVRVSDAFKILPTQEWDVFRKPFARAIEALPANERDAVILVHVLGYKVESEDPEEETAATRCKLCGTNNSQSTHSGRCEALPLYGGPMNQTLCASPRALREALYVLSAEQDVPDAKLLDDIVRRYPEFAEELTEFAIAIAVDSLQGERIVEDAKGAIDPSSVSPAVSRAMSHFQNRLHAVTTGSDETRSTRKDVSLAPNPFLGLPRNEFRAFAARLNANGVFVGKLRDRQIDPVTMTPGFRRRVADELKAPLDVVVAHFAASPATPTGQFFKAEGKPSTGAQQSFEEAVRSSGLNEAQQQFLLEL